MLSFVVNNSPKHSYFVSHHGSDLISDRTSERAERRRLTASGLALAPPCTCQYTDQKTKLCENRKCFIKLKIMFK